MSERGGTLGERFWNTDVGPVRAQVGPPGSPLADAGSLLPGLGTSGHGKDQIKFRKPPSRVKLFPKTLPVKGTLGRSLQGQRRHRASAESKAAGAQVLMLVAGALGAPAPGRPSSTSVWEDGLLPPASPPTSLP